MIALAEPQTCLQEQEQEQEQEQQIDTLSVELGDGWFGTFELSGEDIDEADQTLVGYDWETSRETDPASIKS